MDGYPAAAGIASDMKAPLFRNVDKHKKLTPNPMTRREALQMTKRGVLAAGLPLLQLLLYLPRDRHHGVFGAQGTIENAHAIAANRVAARDEVL